MALANFGNASNKGDAKAGASETKLIDDYDALFTQLEQKIAAHDPNKKLSEALVGLIKNFSEESLKLFDAKIAGKEGRKDNTAIKLMIREIPVYAGMIANIGFEQAYWKFLDGNFKAGRLGSTIFTEKILLVHGDRAAFIAEAKKHLIERIQLCNGFVRNHQDTLNQVARVAGVDNTKDLLKKSMAIFNESSSCHKFFELFVPPESPEAKLGCLASDFTTTDRGFTSKYWADRYVTELKLRGIKTARCIPTDALWKKRTIKIYHVQIEVTPEAIKVIKRYNFSFISEAVNAYRAARKLAPLDQDIITGAKAIGKPQKIEAAEQEVKELNAQHEKVGTILQRLVPLLPADKTVHTQEDNCSVSKIAIFIAWAGICGYSSSLTLIQFFLAVNELAKQNKVDVAEIFTATDPKGNSPRSCLRIESGHEEVEAVILDPSLGCFLESDHRKITKRLSESDAFSLIELQKDRKLERQVIILQEEFVKQNPNFKIKKPSLFKKGSADEKAGAGNENSVEVSQLAGSETTSAVSPATSGRPAVPSFVPRT